MQSIRNYVGVIKEVASFFNASVKRNYFLLNVVHAQLKSLCETRWMERTETIIQFNNELTRIVQALQYISEWSEASTSCKASLRNVDFVLALHCQLHCQKRTDCETEFSTTFAQASDVLQELDVTIELPRINSRQRRLYRANAPCPTPE